MFTLISPAKKLLTFNKPYTGISSEPLFKSLTDPLIKLMKSKSAHEIAQLMDLSHSLAALNYERYQQYAVNKASDNLLYPAIYLFQGDVYQGLNAKDLKPNEINFAQEHLGILSGLYGLLRPLDKIQAYRLEMGVHLSNPKGSNLYVYWREQLTQCLNELLSTHKQQALINLASTEYFKVLDSKNFNYPIITINFYEQKKGVRKMIGIYAKKARGLMARYIVQHHVDTVKGLQDFSEAAYVFDPESSSANHLDFVRTA